MYMYMQLLSVSCDHAYLPAPPTLSLSRLDLLKMSLKTLVRVLLVLTTVSLAVCLLELKADFTDAEWTRFQDFTTRYSRTYRDESERMYRFKVFQVDKTQTYLGY